MKCKKCGELMRPFTPTKKGSKRYVCKNRHTYTPKPAKKGPPPKGDRAMTSTERSNKTRRAQRKRQIQAEIETIITDARKAGFTINRASNSVYIIKADDPSLLGVRIFEDGTTYKTNSRYGFNSPIQGFKRVRKYLDL